MVVTQILNFLYLSQDVAKKILENISFCDRFWTVKQFCVKPNTTNLMLNLVLYLVWNFTAES